PTHASLRATPATRRGATVHHVRATPRPRESIRAAQPQSESSTALGQDAQLRLYRPATGEGTRACLDLPRLPVETRANRSLGRCATRAMAATPARGVADYERDGGCPA